MKTLFIFYWQKLPSKVQAWIKGLEAFVWISIFTAAVSAPFSDFRTKAGIAKFCSIVVSAAIAGVRLYIIQSPVQNVISETLLASKSPGGRETVLSSKTTGPDPVVPPADAK